MFEECQNLSSITIPGNIKTIGSHAFDNCVSLKEVVLSEGIKTIGTQAFLECPELKSITIPSSVTTIEHHAFGYSYDMGDQTFTPYKNFTIKGKANSVAQKYAVENGFKFVAV